MWWTVIAVYAVTAAAVFVPQNPPIKYLPGDAVHPSTVKPGDLITVTRSFHVARNFHGTIARAMIRGDCHIRCDRIALPTTFAEFQRGEYLMNRRPFTIPSSVTAGTWQLVFHVQWRDWLGRDRIVLVPQLQVTVQ